MDSTFPSRSSPIRWRRHLGRLGPRRRRLADRTSPRAGGAGGWAGPPQQRRPRGAAGASSARPRSCRSLRPRRVRECPSPRASAATSDSPRPSWRSSPRRGGPPLVECRGHMHVEMRVDPSGDPARDSGHRHPFHPGFGMTPHQSDDGQDSDGPVRQAPMRALRRTGRCRVRVRARPTNRLEDSPRGRQPVFDGVRPGSGTHPHADYFSLRSGGPSAGYVNPRCRVGEAPLPQTESSLSQGGNFRGPRARELKPSSNGADA